VAKCTTNALKYFPEWKSSGEMEAYGKAQHLHMIYRIEGETRNYSLPEPVPLNTVTAFQGWKWLFGLIPGGTLLVWLWKLGEHQEKDHA
jgi:hypothetical protein